MSTPIDSRNPLFPILWEFLQQRRGQHRFPESRPAESGLTIMECLVAVILIGLTVAMVTPPLLIATATRVQNRRAEQAVQLAQDELDRINTLVQQGKHQSRRLPTVAAVAGDNLQAVRAPSQLFTELKTSRQVGAACPAGSPFSSAPRYTNKQLPVAQALPVDIDGDCTPDFFMQVFRTQGALTPTEARKDAASQRPAKFEIGIRVYSYPLANKNISTGNLKTELAPLLLTNSQGKQATNPLVAVYKAISWSEQSDVLCESLPDGAKEKIATCGS
jgi:type II secretory pathway pseudopilin PulG